eukprot:GEMP01014235.1.p1 GENE.GEMP01014235.1~~GEMP01014235.1.p1  ORF type:complete len:553 (+),score=91.10 GEMP01014235.1:53-1711(+)
MMASWDFPKSVASSRKMSSNSKGGSSSRVRRDPCRGRRAVFDKLPNAQFCTVQETSSCTTQLEECEAFCRNAVARAPSDFHDGDFPPGARCLFRNGECAQSSTFQINGSVQWRRVGEIIEPHSGVNGKNYQASRLIPGPFNEIYLLGVLGALRRVEDPSNLLFVDWEKGVYGCRLYKDGEWIYEVLDDFLPCDATGQLLFGRTSDPHAVWCALILKAYAKIHGSYEHITAIGTEMEALEDLTGCGVKTWPLSERPIWAELWRYMWTRHNRGTLSLAISSTGSSGLLLPGHAYPITEFEKRQGEMLILLQNVWHSGGHTGKYAAMEENVYQTHFWVSAAEFSKLFSHVVEAKLVSPYWQMAATCFSTDRPTYPLISVTSPGQGVIVVTQVDRRWEESDQYSTAIGLRLYRCRTVTDCSGVTLNGSSPFQHMELILTRPVAKTHCVMAEFSKIETDCLYLVHVDTEGTCPRLKLRWYSSSALKFRELSSPEASYFLQAQQCLSTTRRYSFSSAGSFDDDAKDAKLCENSQDCDCTLVTAILQPLQKMFFSRIAH